jgi:transcriptional regulator with GAF, ATPase, and Fis domain
MRDGQQDPFLEHFLPGDGAAAQTLRDTIAVFNRRYKNPPHMGRTVLLLGETGVGKNYAARVIAGHLYWLRNPDLWEPPSRGARSRSLLEATAEHYVEVPLPAIPDELIESELFGHTKGAFTGAEADKDGYFGDEEIHDLLLDEIGDASPRLQVKLLRVLNDRSFRRVGAPPHECLVTQARILVATNRDLPALVRDGRFRVDLYWRMQHLVVRIPPLREQRERIAGLAQSIIAAILRDHGGSDGDLSLSDADIAWATAQPWPGNIRELERLLWRWVYDEGRTPLAEIQRHYPEEGLSAGGVGRDMSLEDFISRRIRDAITNEQTLAPSVGAFARAIEREVQATLYGMKQAGKLDHNSLGKVFGNAKKAAKQISGWRTIRRRS